MAHLNCHKSQSKASRTPLTVSMSGLYPDPRWRFWKSQQQAGSGAAPLSGRASESADGVLGIPLPLFSLHPNSKEKASWQECLLPAQTERDFILLNSLTLVNKEEFSIPPSLTAQSKNALSSIHNTTVATKGLAS